ncbi:phage tail spike protein [Pediococcus acidilactici]
MYVILDRNLERVGSLSNEGGTPFWGDEVSIQIADQDADITPSDVPTSYNVGTNQTNQKNWNHTLNSINIPYGYPDTDKIVIGSSLAYQDPTNSRWYVMRITDIDDGFTASGVHYKSAIGVNLSIWDMLHTKANAWNNDDPSWHEGAGDVYLRQVVGALLENTGWVPGVIDYSGDASGVTISGMDNAQSQLQNICKAFNCEIDAYVLFNSAGQIVEKRIDFVNALGVDDGRTVRFGDDLIDMKRKTTDANLITRLYPYNVNGNGIESVNGGKGYVEDEEANNLYSSGVLNIDGAKFLEGTVQSSTIANLSSLRDWAKTQVLPKFNHPRINYEITLSNNFQAGLGDTIRILDPKMVPEAGVKSRVIQRTISQADPNQNKVIVGEFSTLQVKTPSIIQQIQNNINNKVRDLINDLRNGKRAASVQLITPTGKSWSKEDKSKTIIARVFVDGTNLTSYLSQSAFIWTKTNAVTGVHDLAWEEKHKDDGYQVTLDDGDVGNITCTIEGDYLKTEAELSISVDNSLFFDDKRVNLSKDHWDETIEGAFQYQWYDEVNQMLITSVAYTEGIAGQGKRSNAADTKYHRFKLDGTYVDSMVVQGGGHGSSFGARLVDGVPEIWTCCTNTAGVNYCLGRFKWQPNAIINQGNGLEVVAKMPSIDGHWFRRISCDFEQGWVLSVMASGPVEVLKIDDLLAGKWNPIYSFKIQQFGFNPVPSTEPNFNTMQSNDIHFPYMFINSGDVNKKDPRILSCINVVTESEVFRRENLLETFGDKWVDNYFEPETIGYYHDKDGPYVLQGFTMKTRENSIDYLHRTLFKTRLKARDDSGDKKNYIDTDNSREGENVA